MKYLQAILKYEINFGKIITRNFWPIRENFAENTEFKTNFKKNAPKTWEKILEQFCTVSWKFSRNFTKVTKNFRIRNNVVETWEKCGINLGNYENFFINCEATLEEIVRKPERVIMITTWKINLKKKKKKHKIPPKFYRKLIKIAGNGQQILLKNREQFERILRKNLHFQQGRKIIYRNHRKIKGKWWQKLRQFIKILRKFEINSNFPFFEIFS